MAAAFVPLLMNILSLPQARRQGNLPLSRHVVSAVSNLAWGVGFCLVILGCGPSHRLLWPGLLLLGASTAYSLAWGQRTGKPRQGPNSGAA
jgi:hypothetical protein